ncbi:MAG: hypothetical protein V4582_18870 [Pseudomonadota bacterium]
MTSPTTPDTRTPADPAQARPWSDEADIGSGEKTAAEHETEALIRQIPMLPPQPAPPATLAQATPAARHGKAKPKPS